MKKVLSIILAITLVLSVFSFAAVTVTASSTPAKPAGFKAVNDKDGIDLTWSSVSGATRYYVYRTDYASGSWSAWNYIGNSTTTAFTDGAVKAAAYARYMICAVKGSVRSEYVTTPTIRRLLAPSLSIENDKDGIKVSWSESAGAQKYYIYKKVYSDGDWSAWNYLKTATGVTYTDTSVSSGQYVRYMIKAIDRSYESAYTTTGTLRRLTATTVTSKNGKTGVEVSWTKVSGAQKYYVYKSTYASGTWSAWKYIKSETALKYIDTSVSSGAYVRYMVCAVDRTYRGAYTTTPTLRRILAPTVSATRISNSVKLEWNKVSTAQKYYIYRSVYSSGSWSSWSYLAGTTGLTYTNSNITAGANVKYMVCAVDRSYRSEYTVTPSFEIPKQDNTFKPDDGDGWVSGWY